MKYNSEQFEQLIKVLKAFTENGINVESFNIWDLHYRVFVQFSEGQKHNQWYIEENLIRPLHRCGTQNPEKLINWDYPFELYPNGCNDSHIETAMKKALSIIQS